MKIYIKKHEAHAGKWIYDGYAKAWNFLGHEVDFYNELEDIKDNNDFYLMTLDSCIREENLSIIDNAKKTFLFVQPLKFEMPWGSHPNFVSSLDITLVNKINKKNVIKWTFCEKSKYYQEWEDVQTFPLAFDNISYTNFSKNKNYNFDVCFIGGRANNGFDEKYKIMLEVFQAFKNSNLKCGFFIDKNLSHEQEKSILYNSKIALNIHDAYQRKLGLDTNERSFKSLGINGCIVTDSNDQFSNLFPEFKTANSAEEYVEICKNILMSDSIEESKNIIRQKVLNEHTYVSRIKKMLDTK